MNDLQNKLPQDHCEDLKRDFQVVNRALRVLSVCTQAVIRATDEVTLLQTLCQLITEEAAYRMAWVGYVCHDADKTVQPVVWAGYEAEYLQTANISWADTERGQGPTGRAIRLRQPVACQNMLEDPSFAPWREAARQRGYESSLVLPLLDEGEVFGTLNIYSVETNAFDFQEVELLTELADSLSFGILALRAKQKRQQAELRILRLNEELEQRVEERTAELTQATEELQRSNHELEQFAYVASHDLQEPLRAIAGYTQLLISEYGDRFDDTARSYAEVVSDGAKRMQQLIQDLLTYSRVGTRSQELALTECNAVVQEALRNLQVAIAQSHTVIIVDPLPTLKADQNQLVQLFQNLIGNAIKFCKEDCPRIQIRAIQRETDFLFQVEDNGIGIKPKYLDRIFEVFKRLHTRREYPGTGIGLAICKKIVTRHGGQMWAESIPGIGSTFCFTIPHHLNEQ
ncbi:MAG: ATP-binding protein [Aulosira sp. ZfuVER01]|nr:ATP-binding protein [Aulosira sp. ZfuVER01]MDZ7999515.1 ATP-binding protein [Aulosira sp. DedVER01a]MDZ8056083.1 ATP-binding protein [Aulosira sp. ZfuCHP01]